MKMKMRNIKNKSERGFTIVEMIVSIMIIAILLIAGLYMLSSSITTIASEGNDTKLLYQAQDIMEQVTSKKASAYVDGQVVYSGDEGTIVYNETSPYVLNMSSVGNVDGTLYVLSKQFEDGTTEELLKAFVPN